MNNRITNKRLAGLRKISSFTNQIIDPILGKTKILLKLISEWPLIVGPDIASKCYPIKIMYDYSKKEEKNKPITLCIITFDPIFSSEISFKLEFIKEKINFYLGYNFASAIKLQNNLGKNQHIDFNHLKLQNIDDIFEQENQKNKNKLSAKEILEIENNIRKNISDEHTIKLLRDIIINL